MTKWIDLLVVIAYLGFIAGLGLHFSRRQTSTENYFVAKRSVPFWALGLSMMATLVSSVTFVAYPGSSFAGNWSLLVPGFMLIAMLPFIAKVIIPFYREEVRMSASSTSRHDLAVLRAFTPLSHFHSHTSAKWGLFCT
jgi:SSS family solute:Na+ symporter